MLIAKQPNITFLGRFDKLNKFRLAIISRKNVKVLISYFTTFRILHSQFTATNILLVHTETNDVKFKIHRVK